MSEEVMLDRTEKSAEIPFRSSFPPPPSPHKRSRRDEGTSGCLRAGSEPGDDRRRMIGFCDLPEKVVAEIMSWLPPKSLSQLKCVQKSWYTLISTLMKSPWFVTKHLKHSKSRPSLFRRTIYPEDPHFRTKNSFMTFSEVDDDNDQIYFNTKGFKVPESVAGLCGSHCNGILFLPDKDTNKVLLCNPAIREFKLLQSSCFKANFKTNLMMGFGYDAIANVYKVVRVVRLHSSVAGALIGAEVCTLGSNRGDSWREIKLKIEIDITSLTLDEVYNKGVYYWVICDKSYLKKMIVSFDMHEEEFQTIPFLEDQHQQEFDATSTTTIINWRLCLWDEHVTLFRYVGSIQPWPLNLDGKPIEMWMLDENSGSRGKQSFRWIKCGDLLLNGKLRYYPLAFWKRDELLLFTSQIGLLVSYNLSTQKLRNVQLYYTFNRSYRFFVYVESLVSIAGARKMMTSS